MHIGIFVLWVEITIGQSDELILSKKKQLKIKQTPKNCYLL